MITSAQIRAARALIGWKQIDLAKASGLSEMSIKNIERGDTDPRVSTLAAIRAALEQAGIQFVDDGPYAGAGGPGVRLTELVAPGAAIPVSQASIDASGVEVRSQAASAADRVMVGIDATTAQKTDRRQRLTDEPEVVRKARRKSTRDI